MGNYMSSHFLDDELHKEQGKQHGGEVWDTAQEPDGLIPPHNSTTNLLYWPWLIYEAFVTSNSSLLKWRENWGTENLTS